jgi:hypothetical protein
MRFLPASLSRQQSDAVARRAKHRIEERGWGLWAVEMIESSQFIGFIGLGQPRFDAHFTPAVEVGWRLAHPALGKGVCDRRRTRDGRLRLR